MHILVCLQRTFESLEQSELLFKDQFLKTYFIWLNGEGKEGLDQCYQR